MADKKQIKDKHWKPEKGASVPKISFIEPKTKSNFDWTTIGILPVGKISTFVRPCLGRGSAGKSDVGSLIIKTMKKRKASMEGMKLILASPLEYGEDPLKGKPEPKPPKYFKADGIHLLEDGTVKLRCEILYEHDDCLLSFELDCVGGPSGDHWLGYMMDVAGTEALLGLAWPESGVREFMEKENLAPGQKFWIELTYHHFVSYEGEHDDEVDWSVTSVEWISREEHARLWALVLLNEKLVEQGFLPDKDVRFDGVG